MDCIWDCVREIELLSKKELLGKNIIFKLLAKVRFGYFFGF
jgi:hypothetical protein